MSIHNLESLNPMDFMNIGKRRACAIAEASADLPGAAPHINRFAGSLHPDRQHMRIADVIREGKNCNTYVLVPNEAKGTTACAYFSAGQYLSVQVEINGCVHNRPYSVVSSPREALNGRYAIAVKATEGGFVSQYISKYWSIGDEVEVSAPLGTFTYEPLRDAKHLVGVAGGSGITPFISLAKAISDGDEDCFLTLLYGSRTADEILFRTELEKISAQCERLKVVFVLSNEKNEGCEHGLITQKLIRKYAPDSPYSVFVCGPRGIHRSIDREAAGLGLERKYIRHELYGEIECSSPNTDPVRVTVLCNGEKTEIRGSAGDTVLRILEKNRIAAPAHCRSGECGFCRSRLISGKVKMPKGRDSRRLADERYGYIHPCCAYPMGDIEIEISANSL